MKTTLSQIAFWKSADLVVQLLAFIGVIMLLFLADFGPFALFLEALVQLVSCLIWSCYFKSQTPKYRAGVLIRRAFWLVLIIWIGLSWYSNQVGAFILYCMLFLGPIMGITYFVITAQEAGYYRKARKPFYLL